MDNQWQSKKLYEHPAEHQADEFGKVVLSKAGVYAFQQGGSHMSCPQGWAAKIHHNETKDDEPGGIEA